MCKNIFKFCSCDGKLNREDLRWELKTIIKYTPSEFDWMNMRLGSVVIPQEVTIGDLTQEKIKQMLDVNLFDFEYIPTKDDYFSLFDYTNWKETQFKFNGEEWLFDNHCDINDDDIIIKKGKICKNE